MYEIHFVKLLQCLDLELRFYVPLDTKYAVA